MRTVPVGTKFYSSARIVTEDEGWRFGNPTWLRRACGDDVRHSVV